MTGTSASATSSAVACLAARRGVAVKLASGQTIRITNTHGHQVVDTWAFAQGDLAECMSMEHSRASLLRLNPQVGDTLLSNRRRPMLTLTEDTTPGVHDTLIAACDSHRYRQLGAEGYHDSCTDNLASALDAIGLRVTDTPCPLNLFMNVPVAGDGRLAFEPPVSKPGDHVSLRAEMDLVIVFSACPQDMTPVNGMMPTEVHYQVH